MTALIWPLTWLTVTLIVTGASLSAWRSWLAFKRFEIKAETGAHELSNPGQRIEVAHLKERIRKLEAIAQGVDL